MKHLQALALVVAILFLPGPLDVYAQESGQTDIVLRVPAFENGRHEYFHELLQAAVADSGSSLRIVPILDIPQTRREADLAVGIWADVDWYVRTPERDARFRHARLALADGLVGHRVLLIRPEDRQVFSDIHTLEDLIATGMVAGIGQGWYDYRVWQDNGLPAISTPHIGNLYQMIARGDRRVDYFPLGILEVDSEAESQDHLDVERYLMLIYDRAFRFYFSDTVSDSTVDLIDRALTRAQQSGLQQELMRRHFSVVYDELGFDARRRIYLTAP